MCTCDRYQSKACGNSVKTSTLTRRSRPAAAPQRARRQGRRQRGARRLRRRRSSAPRPAAEAATRHPAPAPEGSRGRAPDGASLLLPLVEELMSVDAEAGVLRVVDGLVDAPAEEPRPGESAT